MKHFLAFLVVATGTTALAGNSTIPGTLRLTPTMECIGVQMAYTGDDNTNNSAVIEFKEVAAATWRTAYTPFIDRRVTIGTHTNNHVRQARGSLVGLSTNTAYDVRVTWSDVDGVTGGVVSGRVTTVARTPITGGTAIWVNPAAGGGGNGSQGAPYNTLAAAIAAASAGSVIKLLPGSYGAQTITKSGTTNAWIKFEAQGAGVSVGGGANSITINNSSNLWFSGLTVPASTQSGFWLNACDRILIDSCTFTNIGTGGGYGHAGVHITAQASRVSVLDSVFHTATKDPGYADGSIFGIYFERGNTNGGHIIAGNRANSIFRDWLGGGGNSWGDGAVCDSDICYNTISGSLDDQIESEGDNRNVRIFGNRLSGGGNTLLAIAGTQVGPLYVFRNVLTTTNGIVAVKLGNDSPGPVYFFHNTIRASGIGTADGLSDVGGDPKSELHHYRNNIFMTQRYGIYRGGRSNSYNANLYHPSSWCVDEYNGSGSFQTLSAFRSATGQEAQGVQGDPLLAVDGTPASISPARDAGLVLANFNDGYAGSAPDIGAVEYTVSTPLLPPSTAPVLTIPR